MFIVLRSLHFLPLSLPFHSFGLPQLSAFSSGPIIRVHIFFPPPPPPFVFLSSLCLVFASRFRSVYCLFSSLLFLSSLVLEIVSASLFVLVTLSMSLVKAMTTEESLGDQSMSDNLSGIESNQSTVLRHATVGGHKHFLGQRSGGGCRLVHSYYCS